MTVQDVVNQLIIRFCEKDVFCFEEIDAIITDKSVSKDKELIVLHALKYMEENGLIVKIDKDKWVLSRPITSIGQDVGLSIQTCILIKDTIIGYYRANNMPYENIDVFNIHEGHIQTLLRIVNDALDNQKI
jgi:hypothetical protein